VIVEAKALRRQLKALAARPEWDLLQRHDLLAGKPPSSWQEHAWRGLRHVLASTGLISPHVTPYPWLLPLEVSSKRLLRTPEDVPADEGAAEFQECFVNVSSTIEACAKTTEVGSHE
jgi:hypothetical protein